MNDLFDAFPLDPCGHTDTDGDGIPNDLFTSINYPCRGMEGDPDDDNDGHLDDDDVFPLDPTEWADFDLDGIGNNADVNDDNDGWSDLMEFVCGMIRTTTTTTQSIPTAMATAIPLTRMMTTTVSSTSTTTTRWLLQVLGNGRSAQETW